MHLELSGEETIQLVHQIYNLLLILTKKQALAGIVLTPDTFDLVKREFGSAAIPYRPAELDLDPLMENTFVVDGLLIMKGTQLQ